MTAIAICAAAGSAAVLLPTAANPQTQGLQVSEFKLANGLEVVVIPDRRTPVVTHMIWYRVGSADETPGKSGLAHFLEHLMFKGTEKNPAGKFSQVVATIGGQENAFTSQDYTAYFQRVTKDNLEQVMTFEADRMTGLRLTDEVVLPERQVVLEERRTRTDNDPAAQLAEALTAALYVNHPYGRPIIGWMHEIRQLSRESALDFYKRFYTPNNAVLVLAGDLDEKEARALAEKTYGKVPRVAEVAPRVRPTEPEPHAHRRLTLTDQRVQQPSMSRYYLVPSYRIATGNEGEALEVLSHVLGGGQTSRLYRALVVEKGLAANAGAWYQGTALDATRFGVYAYPRPGVTLEALEAALDEVIAQIAKDGVDAEEVERVKTRIIASTIFAQDNQVSLARIYGAALTTGLTVASVKEWPAKVRTVTPEDVQKAAKNWLELRRAVTGYLMRPQTAGTPEKRS
ncbi:MAG: insulinase family protein [Xanthobacteraceae bacterium]|nr:insulinase family protein [Xanthobacteraceae bacterium]MBX3522423.1 insulinase family protein [Xanthobacteraceae bacterium]MBX3535033.1 insulinase family protein [Xanthobacteraceae bacterium]MBX3548633.1 insulinase family protein [Xanthobacteraceae bacterium]MCW5673816.1 insulinase family protein [Xanthobacteraceae bacterium]